MTLHRLALLLGLVLVPGCGDDDGGGAAASAASLEGVAWTMESGPSATFADGKVSGSAGCNQYGGSYTLDGTKLTIGQVVSTQMSCGPAADKAERDYLATLDRVAAWQTSGDELVLSDADGKELLRFGVASVEGAWVATSFLQGDGVSSPLAGTEVTAEFGADGTLAGSAGCNTYHASYTADSGRISIDEPATTRKACEKPPGIAEQEQAYLAALPLAVSYRVEGSRLSLLTEKDTFVAIYERAP